MLVMKLNFLKYSAYVALVVLSGVNSSIAMDEEFDTKGGALRRMEEVPLKRQRSNTVVDEDQDDNEASTKITKQNSLSQRSNSDSQRLYNQDFDSQALLETRNRYKTVLADTESDVDTDVDEADVFNFTQSK